jgi:hypothetical protein
MTSSPTNPRPVPHMPSSVFATHPEKALAVAWIGGPKNSAPHRLAALNLHCDPAGIRNPHGDLTINDLLNKVGFSSITLSLNSIVVSSHEQRKCCLGG